MVSLSVHGYTRKEVMDILHAPSGSRYVKFRYDLLNRSDVKIGELSTQPGNQISFNSEAEIKRTAGFVIRQNEANDIDWLNDRIRPVFMLRMKDRGFAEWPLGVFLLSSPRRKEEGKIINRDVEAYDPSVILVEDKFDTRKRIAAGTKYVSAVTEILNGAGIEKVNILDHPGVLGIDKEFEIGTPKIKAVNQLLSEINYTSIWVDENGYFNGRPYVIPSEREVEYEYRNNNSSVLFNGASEELDLFNVPNKWVVIASNPERTELVSRYVNDLPTSKTSTISRKRSIVDVRKVNDILDQPTLDSYTKRIAYESSWVVEKFGFETLAMPHHGFNDCLYCEYSDLGISAKYIETSWSMELIHGGRMAHNARRVIFI